MATLLIVVAAAVPRTARQYAVIFDAGSTGTRVHVFSWVALDGAAGVGGLPDVLAEPGGSKKVTPGISSFEAHPESAGASLTPLLELAERVVPASDHAHTLVLLHATAGMRLLARRRAQRIYTSLYDAVAARNTFRPRRDDFGTLSGSDEGIFGWLCANYLLKRAGRVGSLGSVGALDLGGASTQITLATSAHHGESSMIDPRFGLEAAAVRHGAQPVPKVALPSGAVPVFTHSHLGFGNKQVLAALAAAEAAACLADGATSAWEPGNKSADFAAYLNRGANEGTYMLKGKGDFDACDAAVRRVLHTFDRHGQPALAARTPPRFVAMSLFFYVQHFVAAAGHLPPPAAAGEPKPAPPGGGGVSPAMLLVAARKLCAEPDASLRRMVGRDPLTNEDALRWRCFDATYAARLLTDGYGFGEHDASIEFLGDVDGVEVEWTLGALLNQLLGPRTAAAGGAPTRSPRLASSPDATAAASPSPLLALAGVAAAGVGVYALLRRRVCAPRSARVADYGRVQGEKDSWA